MAWLFGCAQVQPPAQPQVISGPLGSDWPAHAIHHQRKPDQPADPQSRLDDIDAALRRANDVLDEHDKR